MSSTTFFYKPFVRFFRRSKKPLLIGISMMAFLLFLGYQVPITGFKEDTEVTKSEEIISNGKKVTTIERIIPAKKLWDWMDVLIVPLSLVGLAATFQIMQNQKEANTEREVHRARM
jgi:hypothetical protein